MRRPVAGLLFGLCLTVAAPPLFAHDAVRAWVASPDGVGPIKIGMKVADVQRAIGAKLVLNSDASDDEAACADAGVPGHDGMWLMFEKYRVTSITFQSPSPIRTARGIGIGATKDNVLRAYDHLDISPRDYNGEGDPNIMLTYWAVGHKHGVRFLTDSDLKVDEYRIGGDSITYMEGCA